MDPMTASENGASVSPTYSIVIPVLDEEETVPELHRRLVAVLDDLDGPAEMVFVDDGSTDGTVDLIGALGREDPRVRLVRLSRNFGHQIAITAGLDHAQGDAVVIMDGDLQDPPEVIPELARRWREGYHVVYAARTRRRGEGVLKRATASVYYRALAGVSDLQIPRDVGDFRLLDRTVVTALGTMRERARYLRGMTPWVGYRQTAVAYDRDPRHAGESKFTLGKMVQFAIDGLLSFSTAPLRVVIRLGLFISFGAFLYGIIALGLKVTGAFTVPGWTSIVVVVVLIGGVQLVVLGVIGEYVARIHEEVKARPLYLTYPEPGSPPVTSPVAGTGSLGADRPRLDIREGVGEEEPC